MQLKTYKNMCSCSGNCNCNSTTIPRGPQGPTGATGAAATIAVGNVQQGTPAAVTNSGTPNAAVFNFTIPPGSSGAPGIDGINAFSPLTNDFIQPDFVTPIDIDAEPTAWMGIKQIVYISSNTFVGGFYQINSKTGTTVNVTRLDWTAPNVTFVSTGSLVPDTSFIIPSGTIGAPGADGSQGPAGPVIIDSQWNTSSFGTGRLNSLKASIAVAPSYMSVNDDALDIQAIFVVEPNVTINPCAFYLRMSNVNSSTSPLSDIIAEYIPPGGTITTLPSEYFVVHVNCKLQRVGVNRIAVKSEWYSSKQTNSAPFYTNNTVDICMNSLITGAYTLSNSNTFNNTQFIMASADDDTVLSINGRHLEVRSMKRFS